MAGVVMATAAGAAVLLYYTGWADTTALPWPFGKGSAAIANPEEEEERSGAKERLQRLQRIRSQLRRPSKPPSTWAEALSLLAEALRFTYSETLGKWPIHHLAFGINYLLRRQGQLHVAGVYAGEGSIHLKGQETVAELRELSRMARKSYLFAKRNFEGFMKEAGYKREDVLLYEHKAALLKPAFTVVVDHSDARIYIIIRGTHSMKDTLTVVTGSVVPFHHAVLDGSGVKHVVLGYAHCGMVAAARFIARVAEPLMREILEKHPSYKVKVVGHSLGGGTAALLTYVLREKAGFGDTTCTAFAPAACMTWELAESGEACVTSIVHGADIVPTFSAASADDLRAEVTASAWVKDLREQMEKMQILRLVVGSAAALRRRLTSFGAVTYSMGRTASLRFRTTRMEMIRVLQPPPIVTRAGTALWHPVSTGTQVVVRGVQSMVTTQAALGLPSWNCMGERHRDYSQVPPLPKEEMSEEDEDSMEPCSVATMCRERNNSALSKGKTTPSLRTKGEDLGDEEEEEEEEEGEGWQETAEPWKPPSRSPRNTPEDREDAAALAVLVEALKGDPDEEGEDSDEAERQPEDGGRKEGPSQRAEYSWEELEEQLSRNLDSRCPPNEEEQAAALEITREEEEVASQATSQELVEREAEEGMDFLHDPRRFFPCGRVLHLVRNDYKKSAEELEDEEMEGEMEGESDWKVGVFLTERSLYGRVHLSRNMITDHFMTKHMKAMEEIIEELEEEIRQRRKEEADEEEEEEGAMACLLLADSSHYDKKKVS